MKTEHISKSKCQRFSAFWLRSRVKANAVARFFLVIKWKNTGDPSSYVMRSEYESLPNCSPSDVIVCVHGMGVYNETEALEIFLQSPLIAFNIVRDESLNVCHILGCCSMCFRKKKLVSIFRCKPQAVLQID